MSGTKWTPNPEFNSPWLNWTRKRNYSTPTITMYREETPSTHYRHQGHPLNLLNLRFMHTFPWLIFSYLWNWYILLFILLQIIGRHKMDRCTSYNFFHNPIPLFSFLWVDEFSSSCLVILCCLRKCSNFSFIIFKTSLSINVYTLTN